MARYAVVEGVSVTNVIEYDPDKRRLPPEEEQKMVKIMTLDPVANGWTWDGAIFRPPFVAPLPRQTTVGEGLDDLETQFADLQLQVNNAMARITDLEDRQP